MTMLNNMSGINYRYHNLISQIQHIRDIKEDSKTKISIVQYHPFGSDSTFTCILRVCKGRNLSDVCELLTEVKNLYVVTVYDYAYENGDTYILEEQVIGTTVDELIEREGLFSQYKTAAIAADICGGLIEFHKKQPPIIHNDIKPSNIMIRNDGGVKLFDFDISRTYKESKTQNTELFVTKGYAAPEQYGSGQTDPRSDLFSLGVTMHMMLTGRFPDNNKVLHKGKLAKIIQKCIEIDPKRRYSDAKLLKKELERFLQRKKRFFRIFITTLCLVLILVVTGITAHLLRGGQNADERIPANGGTDQTATQGNGQQLPSNDKPSQNNLSRKIKIAKQLSGELLSMVAVNDGTVVYLEEISGEYRLKTLNGADSSVAIPDEAWNERCGLIYNDYTDSLYLIVAVPSSDTYLYAVDDSYKVSDRPIYLAATGDYNNLKGMFFSDGVLYCPAFERTLIDTNLWSEMGDADIDLCAVLGDSLYTFDTLAQNIDEINMGGNILAWHGLPIQLHGKDACFGGSKNIYLAGSKSDKDYIYSFDGVSFSSVVCLNDYQYYTEWSFDDFCVTEDVIWLYKKESNVIEAVEIE